MSHSRSYYLPNKAAGEEFTQIGYTARLPMFVDFNPKDNPQPIYDVSWVPPLKGNPMDEDYDCDEDFEESQVKH